MSRRLSISTIQWTKVTCCPTHMHPTGAADGKASRCKRGNFVKEHARSSSNAYQMRHSFQHTYKQLSKYMTPMDTRNLVVTLDRHGHAVALHNWPPGLVIMIAHVHGRLIATHRPRISKIVAAVVATMTGIEVGVGVGIGRRLGQPHAGSIVGSVLRLIRPHNRAVTHLHARPPPLGIKLDGFKHANVWHAVQAPRITPAGRLARSAQSISHNGPLTCPVWPVKHHHKRWPHVR